VTAGTTSASKGPIAAVTLVLAVGVGRQLRRRPGVPRSEARAAIVAQRCWAVGAGSFARGLAPRNLAPAARPVAASAAVAVNADSTSASKGPIAAVTLVLAVGVGRQLRRRPGVPRSEASAALVAQRCWAVGAGSFGRGLALRNLAPAARPVAAGAAVAVNADSTSGIKGPIAAVTLVLAVGVRWQLRRRPGVPRSETRAALVAQRCWAVGAGPFARGLAPRNLAPAARPVTAGVDDMCAATALYKPAASARAGVELQQQPLLLATLRLRRRFFGGPVLALHGRRHVGFRDVYM